MYIRTYVFLCRLLCTTYVPALHCSHVHPSTPHSPQLLDGNPLQVLVLQDVQQHVGPVAAVAELAEVRERFLRGPHHLLQLGELVAAGYKELAVALPLVGGQGHDACHVVVL